MAQAPSAISSRAVRIAVAQFLGLEPQVGSDRLGTGLAEAGVELGLEAGHGDVGGRPDVQQRVQRAPGLVGHEDLHLPLGQVLDVVVERARLRLLSLGAHASR